MIDIPLHPAIVHLPLGLIFFAPLVGVLILILAFKDKLTKTILLFLPLVHLVIFAGAFAALETGEDQEDIVEKVVDEKFIEQHEEAAEALFYLSIVAFGSSLIPLTINKKNALKVSLTAIVILQAALLLQAYKTGHSGGELVYIHKAVDAY